jgi:hypothetical protein
MRVAEDQRAGTADVIDVLVAISKSSLWVAAPEGFLTADDVIVMNSVSVDGGAQPLV